AWPGTPASAKRTAWGSAFSAWPHDDRRMSMIEQRRAASGIVRELNDALNEIILPEVVSDRVGFVSEQAEKEIRSAERIDLRLPRFLAVSGKGGPGHEEWSNITLFDHSSSVGMAAATFAALDL